LVGHWFQLLVIELYLALISYRIVWTNEHKPNIMA
jgi:hypothetical protein